VTLTYAAASSDDVSGHNKYVPAKKHTAPIRVKTVDKVARFSSSGFGRTKAIKTAGIGSNKMIEQCKNIADHRTQRIASANISVQVYSTSLS
jgi:hypothetical protein